MQLFSAWLLLPAHTTDVSKRKKGSDRSHSKYELIHDRTISARQILYR